jgi:hypothetical protein
MVFNLPGVLVIQWIFRSAMDNMFAFSLFDHLVNDSDCPFMPNCFLELVFVIASSAANCRIFQCLPFVRFPWMFRLTMISSFGFSETQRMA